MASMSLAGSRASYDSGYMVCVSGSSCSLFGCTSGAMLGSTMDTYLRLLVQFFGWSSTCPLLCNDRALVRHWRKLWAPQLHSSWWSLSRLAGRADSLVQVWRRQSSPTDAAYPHAFLDKVVDMPSLCHGRCLIFGAETADSPQLQVHRQGVGVPVIIQRQAVSLQQ